jgi:hypothetical protein
MIAVFSRELVVVTRRVAFTVACCVLVFALAVIALAWPAGIPLYAGASLFPQLAVIQQLTLAVIAPWVVCRCGTRERGDDLVHLSLFSAVSPSRILFARFGASTVALLVVALTALPILLYAQQVTAMDSYTVLGVVARTIAILPIAAAWTLVCEQTLGNVVVSWLCATAATVLTATLALAGGIAVPAMCVVVSMAGLCAVAIRADTVSRYLAEEAA